MNKEPIVEIFQPSRMEIPFALLNEIHFRLQSLVVSDSLN
jgi:hypothetical protein